MSPSSLVLMSTPRLVHVTGVSPGADLERRTSCVTSPTVTLRVDAPVIVHRLR
ncbi:hypothetical protein ACFPM0_08120 [Pseudonocardia sulfidoxydans]|uniref:hypothetical protein n=1 Tax=Pseudonocardia sulfidoxydans TaxID=54011 RepID=UPI00361F08D5